MIDLEPFSDNVRRIWTRTSPCTLCPRNCRAKRREGQTGFCGIGEMPVVSSVGPHFGEESVLVGTGGSGTIFLAGCNLGCVFCQNYDISHHRVGRRASTEQLTQSMLELQHIGCSNINFVTPTHVVAPIATAIELARAEGLSVPIVYNTGGYDSVETLKLLEGLIDVYMPDMKYAEARVAEELSAAADYPEMNFAAVREMHRQVGDLRVEHGLATRGLLVRPARASPRAARQPRGQFRDHRLPRRRDQCPHHHQRNGAVPALLSGPRPSADQPPTHRRRDRLGSPVRAAKGPERPQLAGGWRLSNDDLHPERPGGSVKRSLAMALYQYPRQGLRP